MEAEEAAVEEEADEDEDWPGCARVTAEDPLFFSLRHVKEARPCESKVTGGSSTQHSR